MFFLTLSHVPFAFSTSAVPTTLRLLQHAKHHSASGLLTWSTLPKYLHVSLSYDLQVSAQVSLIGDTFPRWIACIPIPGILISSYCFISSPYHWSPYDIFIYMITVQPPHPNVSSIRARTLSLLSTLRKSAASSKCSIKFAEWIKFIQNNIHVILILKK